MTGLAPLAADDAAVIEASFARPDRFASLFDRHAPHIHRYLARRVGRQAADDLVAETFLVAFGKRKTYDTGFRDARPWLYGIATNLVAQHRREETRQFRLSQAAGSDGVQSDCSERTVVNLTAQSVRSSLAEALAHLAQPDRDVLLLIAVVSAGAAAAVAAAVMAGGTHSSVRVPGKAAGAPRATVPLPAHLTAREVLKQAAAAALRSASVVPRGDQFVYTNVTGGKGEEVSQTWLSVDGIRDGLTKITGADGKTATSTILGCANGVRHIRLPGTGGKPAKGTKTPVPAVINTPAPMDGPVVTEPCTPTLAYLPGMPTTAAAMGAYLERAQGIRPGNLNDLAKTVGYLLESDYILPAQRAALYEYLATTPGLIVEHNVRDISGRPGVGVGWSFEGGRAMNVFDPATYAYLGMVTWGIHGEVGGDALIKTAIVNHPGQLP